jgi:hypothetical protein
MSENNYHKMLKILTLIGIYNIYVLIKISEKQQNCSSNFIQIICLKEKIGAILRLEKIKSVLHNLAPD